MKRLLMMCGLVLVVLVSAFPSKAQVNIVRADTCHAQACLLYVWNPVRDGDTIVVVVRQIMSKPPICSSIGCGWGNLLMVTDNHENIYQHAYPVGSWFDRVFVAFNVKGTSSTMSANPYFYIGVVASFGTGDTQGSTGGYFDFDVMILELPPATGFATPPTAAGYFKGGGSDEVGVNPPVNITVPNPGKTLLVTWSVLRWYGNAPMSLTYVKPPWSLAKDDGFIAVAIQEVTNPGTYDFEGTYNNYGFWDAGILAFAMK